MYNYNGVEQKLADELIKLGFRISSKGFKYIVKSLPLIYKDEIGICKIYAIIALRCKITSKQVERAIRSDITSYYDNIKDIPSLLECDSHTGMLPNKEFLFRLAYMLRDILEDNTDKS